MVIQSDQDAHKSIRWYCLRWRIEDWHRVLKTGCRIEEVGFKGAERLKRHIAINAVIAWRIMLMTLLGRQFAVERKRAPQWPAQVMFSDLQIKVLEAYAKKKRSHP